MKQLIKIDKELINYLRISYKCPSCLKQVILTPDIWDKEYLTCGECHYSLHIRSNQAQFLKDLIFEFDKCRKILEMNGLQVWIEGQQDTIPLIRGSTTSTYTRPSSSQ
jgi:ribosomal protein S27AE